MSEDSGDRNVAGERSDVGQSQPPRIEAPRASDGRISRGQGVALSVAAALTLAGAAYSVSTLDSRQALAANQSTSPANSPAAQRPGTSSPSPSPSRSPVTGSANGSASPSPGGPASSGPASSGTADGLLQPPAPWERLSDAAAKTGKVDLERAVEIDGHGNLSRTGLQQLGFVSGIGRAWQAGGSALLVLDYTFRDAKGAAGFVTYGRRARDADAGFRRTSVTGIPGAAGYESRSEQATRVVLFARNRSAYIVGVQGAPPAGDAGNLNTLARQQYEAAAS